MQWEAKVEAASPPLKPDNKRQDAASTFPNRYGDESYQSRKSSILLPFPVVQKLFVIGISQGVSAFLPIFEWCLRVQPFWKPLAVKLYRRPPMGH